jgi:hypothetical protein
MTTLVGGGNVLYPKAKEAFLGGDLDWDQDHRVVLHDNADDTPDDADDFLNDVAAGARVATSGAIGSPTKTLGVADAADMAPAFAAATGDVAECLIIYRHTGNEATANLVAFIESATGLPVTPNGGDINITWDSGANKIFKL